MTSCGIEFLGFIQPTIATYHTPVPSESAGAKYLCQIIKQHPLQGVLHADMVLGGDTAQPANYSSVTALQAMQVG